MFIESHVTVGLPADVVSRRLQELLTGAALAQESEGAEGDGMRLAWRAGPGRVGLGKSVRATVLEPRHVARTTVIPLRWEATGPTGAWYPTLDANIGLTAVDEVTCVLSVVGSYTPPLGAFGAAVDQAVFYRVATATIDSLVRRLADLVRLEPPVPLVDCDVTCLSTRVERPVSSQSM